MIQMLNIMLNPKNYFRISNIIRNFATTKSKYCE